MEEGHALKSYGLNVASLAEIPQHVVQAATKKADEMEKKLSWLVVNLKLFCVFFEVLQTLENNDISKMFKVLNRFDF